MQFYFKKPSHKANAPSGVKQETLRACLDKIVWPAKKEVGGGLLSVLSVSGLFFAFVLFVDLVGVSLLTIVSSLVQNWGSHL